jgi:hypothetical protein
MNHASIKPYPNTAEFTAGALQAMHENPTLARLIQEGELIVRGCDTRGEGNSFIVYSHTLRSTHVVREQLATIVGWNPPDIDVAPPLALETVGAMQALCDRLIAYSHPVVGWVTRLPGSVQEVGAEPRPEQLEELNYQLADAQRAIIEGAQYRVSAKPSGSTVHWQGGSGIVTGTVERDGLTYLRVDDAHDVSPYLVA